MVSNNTVNGKAFEYACLNNLYKRMQTYRRKVSIIDSPAFKTANAAYNSLPPDAQNRYDKGANTGIEMLVAMEPRLVFGDDNFELSIAADNLAKGPKGDVRDVCCFGNHWQFGISCKHNHDALKHPRITAGKDFGSDWMEVPCSKEFIDEVSPVIDQLIVYGDQGTQWNTIPNKQNDYYVPILNAYMAEFDRMCQRYGDIPTRLMSYFFGYFDFYKVIMHEAEATTTVEAFNMKGTLNQPYNGMRPVTRIPVTKMPTRLYDARFKDGSGTTIVLTFDAGWSITMRLHNKDRIAKPTSLAWDVKLEGLPSTSYHNTQSWEKWY